MSASFGPVRALAAATLTTASVALIAAWSLGSGILPSPPGGVATPGWSAAWWIAAALMLGSSWVSTVGNPRHAVVLAAAAAALIGPVLAMSPGIPPPVRIAGAATGAALPMAVVCLSLLVATAPRACGPLTVALGATALAILARGFGYDPLVDPDCVKYCVPLPGRVDLPVSQPVLRVGISLLGAVAAVSYAAWAWVSRRAGGRLSLVALALGALTVSPVGPPDLNAVAVAGASGAVVLAAALGDRRRRAAARLLASLELDGSGDVGTVDERWAPAVQLAWRNRELSRETSALRCELRDSRSELVAAYDQERDRVGRDLHDTVQQRVVGALLLARVSLDEEREPHRREALESVIDLLVGVLPRLRGVSERAASDLVDSDGPAAALEQITIDLGWRFVGSHDPVHLDHRVARTLCAVVEALVTGSEFQAPGTVGLTEVDQGVRVSVTCHQLGEHEVVADRVAAAGGTLSRRRCGAVDVVEVLVPCAW